MFNNSSDRIKAFIAVLFIFIIIVLLSFFTQDLLISTVVSLSFGFILFITKSIWLPDGIGKTRVRIYSLAIALLVVSSYSFWNGLVESYSKAIVDRYFPDLLNNYPIADLSPELALAFIFGVIFIVNYFNRDNTGMGIHPKPIKEDIQERSFEEKLIAVSQSLTEDLRSIDIKTNWSTQLYTPLDAEVEVNTSQGKEKKITDLLKAIKKSKKRLFLVLGDPGAGKSVALRKLCKDLGEEVIKTGKIPIYINLKEWVTEVKWTEANPPTVNQLYDFVLSNVKSRDIVSSKFFDQFFMSLYDSGRLYFVLDSFDEIPAVLDEKENSELIQILSEVCFKFLKGARDKESQGILSSRIFRKPTSEFQADSILEIRPFTEEKIIQTLKRSNHYDDNLVYRLFKERAELVPIARNPFSATLISEFAENNNNKLPANQSEMYESYITRTLKSCNDKIIKKNLTVDKVIKGAVDIADMMFAKFGLEAPISELKLNLPNQNIEEVIEILKFARIGRSGVGDENQFSFVHRRFAEYFFVQKAISQDHSIDMASIPNDSQLRDALVLYCEVASEDKARSIAEYCWNIISTVDDPLDPSVIHCMRFLRDAFKGRLNCIEGFRDDLKHYVFKYLKPNTNIIIVKLAVETLGLLKEQDIDYGVKAAMEFNNSWISETAFKSCRHLPKISYELEGKLMIYLNDLSTIQFVEQRDTLSFSLKLSDSFASVSSFFNSKFINILWAHLTIAFSILFFPRIFATAYFIGVLFILLINPLKSLKQRFYKLDIMYNYVSLLVISTLILALFSIFFPTKENETRNAFFYRERFAFSLIFIPHLGVILGYHRIKFFKRLYKLDFSWRSVIGGVVSLFLTYVLMSLFIYISRDFPIFVNVIWYLIVCFLGLGFLLFLIVVVSDHIKGLRIFKKVNVKSCHNREYIYKIFNDLDISNYYQLKFVFLLESNVKYADGAWPNIDFFSIRFGEKGSQTESNHKEAFIRLAKLEEKWLGIDK